MNNLINIYNLDIHPNLTFLFNFCHNMHYVIIHYFHHLILEYERCDEYICLKMMCVCLCVFCLLLTYGVLKFLYILTLRLLSGS